MNSIRDNVKDALGRNSHDDEGTLNADSANLADVDWADAVERFVRFYYPLYEEDYQRNQEWSENAQTTMDKGQV